GRARRSRARQRMRSSFSCGKSWSSRSSPVVAPGPIPAEELRRFFENLPKTWKVAQAVGMARAVREAGHEAPDLSAQEAHLESLLPMLREFGRTASGDDARTHFTVGYILNALGRTEEAEEPLRRAFALNPHSPTIV